MNAALFEVKMALLDLRAELLKKAIGDLRQMM